MKFSTAQDHICTKYGAKITFLQDSISIQSEEYDNGLTDTIEFGVEYDAINSQLQIMNKPTGIDLIKVGNSDIYAGYSDDYGIYGRYEVAQESPNGQKYIIVTYPDHRLMVDISLIAG